MIPVSVSDLLKILDQIPIWRTLASLPKRLEAIEARLTALEAAKPSLPPASVVNPAKACPMCGSEMKVHSEQEHLQFGFAGLKLHKMTCPDCGHEATRDFSPGKGYT